MIKKQYIKFRNTPLGVHLNLRCSKLKSNYYKVIKNADVVEIV